MSSLLRHTNPSKASLKMSAGEIKILLKINKLKIIFSDRISLNDVMIRGGTTVGANRRYQMQDQQVYYKKAKPLVEDEEIMSHIRFYLHYMIKVRQLDSTIYKNYSYIETFA
jgi:hypothetical protein